MKSPPYITALIALLLIFASISKVAAQFTTEPNGLGTGVIITGYTGSNASVLIPNQVDGDPVTAIGSYIFGFSNTTVTSVTIQSGPTSIYNGAFENCSSLISVTIPGSVTHIYSAVFENCTSLTNVAFPDGLLIIEDSVFKNCTSLTGVTIPDSVQQIGDGFYTGNPDGVFENCTSLASVTIGKGITSYASETFDGCNNITSLSINSNLGDYPFSYGTLLNLTNLTIGTSVTNIGASEFASSPRLNNVTIPNSVTSIGLAAFAYSGLTSVTIPSTVTSVGDDAFGGCASLTAIGLAAGNPGYVSVGGILFNLNQTTLIQYPPGKADTSYSIPTSVTSIESYAFDACLNLTSVTIPDGVSSIGDEAFGYSANLARAIFDGNAPTTGATIFDSTAANFTVFYPVNAAGFTTPIWTDSNGDNYPALNSSITLTGNMAFGFQPINSRVTSILTITNQTSSPLTVTSIDYPTGFSGDWSGGMIAANASQNVNVTFSPTLVISYGGDIAVNSNAVEGTDTIAASGNGVAGFGVSSIWCDATHHVYFLDQVSLPVTFTITGASSWDVIEGSIDGGAWQTLTLTSGQCVFDVGQVFGVGGSLSIRGRNNDGTTSKPVKANFDVYDPPQNLGQQTSAWSPSMNAPLVYTAGFNLEPVFTGTDTIQDDESTGDPIPFLTDTPFDLNISLSTQVQISGTGFAKTSSITSSEGSEFQLSKLTVKPSVTTNLNWTYDPIGEEWNPGGGVTLNFNGSAKSPTIYFLPDPPVYGSVEFTAQTSLGLQIYNPGLTGATAFPSFRGDFNIQPTIRGTLGLGLSELLNVEGYVQGSGVFDALWNGPTPMTDQLNATLSGGVSAKILTFENEQELFSYKWDYFNASPSLSKLLIQAVSINTKAGNWVLSPRALGKASGVAKAADASAAGAELLLQANCFPQSECQAITANGNMVVFRLVDDPARSSINRTKLVWQTVGATASAPVAVADDGAANFSPAVAPLPQNKIAVAWQKASSVLPDTATLDTALGAQQIVVSTVDPGAGTATTPHKLSQNTWLARSPSVATLPDGTIFVVWIENTANDPLGSATATNMIRSAMCLNGVWQPTETVASGLGAITWLTTSFVNGTPTMVIGEDADGDLSTTTDQELFAIQKTTTWQAPQQLTTDTAQDTFPLFLSSPTGGVPILAWLRGGQLWTTSGVDMTQAAMIPFTGNTGFTEFAWCVDASGMYYIATPGQTSGGLSSVQLLVRDGTGTWQGPVPVIADDNLRRSLACAVDSTGTARVAYNKVALADDGQGNLSLGEEDCDVASLAVLSDLTVPSVVLSPTAPSVGDAVQIVSTVSNMGLTASPACTLNVVQRTSSGDTAIGTVSVPALLPGASATCSVPWTVASGAATDEIVAIADSGDVVVESSKTNNEGSVSPFLADLAITGETISDPDPTTNQITATLNIVNQGLTDSPAGVAVTAYSGSLTGTVLSSVTLSAPVAAGATVSQAITWTAPTFATAFGQAYFMVDSSNIVTEISKDNNWIGGVVKSGFLSYTQWSTNYGLAMGQPATPPLDGVPNVLKYVCDIVPAQQMAAADRAELPTGGVDSTTTPGTKYVTLTYRQYASLSGVTVNFQTSTDLETWTTVTPDLSQQIGTDATTGDPIMEMGMKSTGVAQEFIRLDVTSP